MHIVHAIAECTQQMINTNSKWISCYGKSYNLLNLNGVWCHWLAFLNGMKKEYVMSMGKTNRRHSKRWFFLIVYLIIRNSEQFE